ncbi:MAG TPA: thioredoxin domain-containing protein [Polyangiaceae bacterium]|nr:thioredoxin domain-containing protein [Polyangiaceae bacterium]
MHETQNRLAGETSPYLLQHARNPVDWYPWGPEALERARREDKPILLSIGYAACHWCHVMERECFENPEIAALMNAHFVCVKVDREERPDLDDIYMSATVALNGGGGWPMTVFLTPEREPFFAGTYFPPESRHGLIGFPLLLTRLRDAWRDDRDKLLRRASELTGYLRGQAAPQQPGRIGDEVFAAAVAELSEEFDPEFGGFGAAPKFPPCAALSLLLRAHRRTRDPGLLHMVQVTLDGMKNGGIYDHLAGGFARYSTDERWLIPHFEKMLYDNAQLAAVYLEAFQATGTSEYARVARETLDFVLRDLQSPEGGYYSSLDADSEGEEGKFAVFTPEQIHRALEPRIAQLFCGYYDVTPMGNWEHGQSVLNTPRSLEQVAASAGMPVGDARALLELARQRIHQLRQERAQPALDDKVLTSWNGLMIGAMAEGARILGQDRYFISAARAARHVLSALRRPDGGLYRVARAGKVQLDAVLEDYAFLADGLISLYEASGQFEHSQDAAEFLYAARVLVERMTLDFGGEDGAFHATARQHEELLLRRRDGHDGALPSANAVAARALVRLGHHFGRSDWTELGVSALEAHAATIERAPRAFATSLNVLERARERPTEVVSAGKPGDAKLRVLLARAASVYLPNAAWANAEPDLAEPDQLPMTRGKQLVKGSPALYLCSNFACQAPIVEPDDVVPALQSVRPLELATSATASAAPA